MNTKLQLLCLIKVTKLLIAKEYFAAIVLFQYCYEHSVNWKKLVPKYPLGGVPFSGEEMIIRK